MKTKKQNNVLPDGVYQFEHKTAFAMKRVTNGKVKYNDGTLVDVDVHIRANGYTKVKRIDD